MARMHVDRMQGMGGDAARGATDAAREAGPWLIRLARVGYVAKGVVYLVIGGMALRGAMGQGGGATDSRGALRVIGDGMAGQAALVVVGVGLVAFALWALVAAATDADRRGGDAKGIALRLGQAGRGLAYGALGVSAFGLLRGSGGGSGGGAERWTSRLMDAPFGRTLVAAAGLGIMAYALYQFWRAARKNLRKRLHMEHADPDATRWVIRVARFGIAARGVVFLVIGGFLAQAALREDASHAGGIADSLTTIGAQPYGRALLALVAVGLLAYGVWELLNARYREMRVE